MPRKQVPKTASCTDDQLSLLRDIACLLASEIETAETKEITGLVRQYRETLRDIRELEGGIDDDDEVGEIVLRLRSGKP